METAAEHPAQATRKDVYAIITDRVIEQLVQGTVPWHVPWTNAGIPTNLISKRPYRGINTMLLASLGYETNLFLTFKQLEELNAKPVKGEKGYPVVYWDYKGKQKKEADNEDESIDEQDKKKKKATLLYYTVFNIAQCEGIPDRLLPPPWIEDEPITVCENIVTNMPQCPNIVFKEQAAFYDPLRDYVNMPKRKSFESNESYYSTLFHELIHSTGHHSRLGRKELIQMAEFGSDTYSQEELIAEMGTCYLQSLTGIKDQFQQSAAYIQGWLQKLRNDRYFIFTAASQAQKATDFILNVKDESDETGPKDVK